jgi:hypothetical protein
LTGFGVEDCWIILQLKDYDYTNSFGVNNDAGTDKLAAFFRKDIYVNHGMPPNTPPEIIGIEDEEGSGTYSHYVTPDDLKTYWVIYTDPDPDQDHTITWYIVNDGEDPGSSDEVMMPIDWGTYGIGEYDIYVDVYDGFDEVQGGPYDISVIDTGGGVITFGGTGTEYALAHAVDSEGGKYCGGYFFGDANLDPDGNDPHYQVGGGNMWLNKINANGTFAWGYSWPSMDGYHSYVWEIVVDEDDDIYVVGHFNGIIDFDPGSGVDMHTASGGNGRLDAFLWKFDKDGDYIWGKSWGGDEDVTAFDIWNYDSQYLYIAGYFFGTADIDPSDDVDYRTATSDSGNVTDGYLIKIDMDANYQWGRTFGAGGTTYCFRCTADGNGNPTATGTFENTVDLDPTGGVQNFTSNGWGDTYLIRFLADGTWDWSFSIGGNSWDQVNELTADSSGNIYANGGFASSQVDFDPGSGTHIVTNAGASYDGFLAKYDQDGNFVWVDMFAEPDHDNTWGSDIDADGNILMCGHFNGTMDMDPGLGVDNHVSNGEADAYVVKVNPDGEYIWATSWGGPSFDNAESVTADFPGLIHINGEFSDTVDFDPGSDIDQRTSNGNYDVYIEMFLPDGGW